MQRCPKSDLLSLTPEKVFFKYQEKKKTLEKYSPIEFSFSMNSPRLIFFWSEVGDVLESWLEGEESTLPS